MRISTTVRRRPILQDIILPIRTRIVIVAGAILAPKHLIAAFKIHGKLQDSFTIVLTVLATVEGPVELARFRVVWVEVLGVRSLLLAEIDDVDDVILDVGFGEVLIGV